MRTSILLLCAVLGACASDPVDVSSETGPGDLAGLGKADGDYPEHAILYGAGTLDCAALLDAKAAADRLEDLRAHPPVATVEDPIGGISALSRHDGDVMLATAQAQPYEAAQAWIGGWVSGANQVRTGDMLGQHTISEVVTETLALCAADRTETVGGAAVAAIGNVRNR